MSRDPSVKHEHFLPLELSNQDEVGGSACEGGSAPNAGRVGDGNEETFPDVSAIFPLLLGVSGEIRGYLDLLEAIFALNRPKRNCSEKSEIWALG